MTDQERANREVHDTDIFAGDLPDFLNRWVSAQRWFPNGRVPPALSLVGQWTLASPDPDVQLRTLLVRDESSRGTAVYQVPISERVAPAPHLEPALIGVAGEAAGAARFVYDGTHDTVWVTALLRFIVERGLVPEQFQASSATIARGQPIHAAHPSSSLASRVISCPVRSSRVLTGEQSNTSIICDLGGGDRSVPPVICKVFRAIHHGQNPDVVVQSVLAQAGSIYIPEPLGAVAGEWNDPGQPDGRASGHLVFVQEFIPDVADAWRTALLAAAAGEDFSEPARRLGHATAGVHADLAAAMPTLEATPRVMVTMVTAMLDRFRQAAIEVPSLLAVRPEVERIFARALTVPWQRLQRIHGDFHLGQVLDVPGRGWILLDFEGEPLRAVSERDQPDAPLRDVAGMLRSFDYVSGTVTHSHPHLDPERVAAWALACRRAFLQGYALGSKPRGSRQSMSDGERESGDHAGDNAGDNALLTALELDKAIYETVYETRNRPDWLPLPLAAVRRITSTYARSRNDHD
ncbi:maltokinase N-terminal cap-like domain-containing protein [Cryobacterium psychrophilum]|uniref:Maltokinase n=1 Tax=Cryobacterium psychrophilum TaxID=41988 RepID=A0A4Y8KY80_9MICO|nr:phosphotransferase [Cryobacterium psychrophilum]TDW28671.1 putative trehalose synthase [Cryobacterium psychrophilum]TFD82331.1 phosphotransferase [Cryobacterium psychrophilum]